MGCEGNLTEMDSWVRALPSIHNDSTAGDHSQNPDIVPLPSAISLSNDTS